MKSGLFLAKTEVEAMKKIPIMVYLREIEKWTNEKVVTIIKKRRRNTRRKATGSRE